MTALKIHRDSVKIVVNITLLFITHKPGKWNPVNMNEITRCYKIVDSHGENYKTLFHGVGGSRILPFNQWIKSERKWAGEGGTKYWTGFHVLLSKSICINYLKRFTDKNKTRVIVECLAKNLRPKESSKGSVFLADEIMIPN